MFDLLASTKNACQLRATTFPFACLAANDAKNAKGKRAPSEGPLELTN